MKLFLWSVVVFFGSVVFAQSIAPAAAPWWLHDTILAIEAIPVVGPVVAQITMWFGIILVIVTALCKAASAIIAALSGVAGFAGLDKASAALDAFENSSAMYWLNYISGFNKPASPSK